MVTLIILISTICASVIIDQITKAIVTSNMEVGETIPVIEDVFHFTYVRNEGAAFGMLAEHRWIFMVLSTLGIVAVLIYLWKFRPQSKLACTALSLIIGGGIGNMIDRIFRSGTLAHTVGKNVVIDFIDFCAFPNLWSYVFNLADAFVCVGAGLLILYLILDIVKETKKERAEKASGEALADSKNDGDSEDV